MANFGLARLRLVKPRDGWPNLQARRSASGADRILDGAALFDTVAAAIADCTLVLATTARAHDQAKPVLGPDEAAAFLAPHVAAGETVAVLFGRERYGLENDEVALADRIVTFPVNPAFASLNLAQAVALVAYEWFKLASGGALPFAMPQKSQPAPQAADRGLLRQSRTPARPDRVLPSARQARDHAGQSAQYLRAHAADPAGHPDLARHRHGADRRPQGTGARRRARRRGGEGAAGAARRIRRSARAGRARAGARPGAAASPQPDRGRADAVAGAHHRPPLRRPGLQAPGPGRHRTSPISCRFRCAS